MIKVLVKENGISVSGHAGTAPKGQDIVCAAVSALTLNLIQGLEQVAGVKIQTMSEPGNICIKWQHLNDTGKALIDSWFLGICGIADSYNCIQFV